LARQKPRRAGVNAGAGDLAMMRTLGTLATILMLTSAAGAEEHRFDIGSFVLVVNLAKDNGPSSGIAMTGNPDDSALAIKCSNHKLSIETVSKNKAAYGTNNLIILFRVDNQPVIHMTGGILNDQLRAASDDPQVFDELRSGATAAVQIIAGENLSTMTFPLEKAADIVAILTKTCSLPG
jgi:hypothetical protein